MKRFVIAGILLSILAFVIPAGVMAQDFIAEADLLFDQGGLENYQKAVDLYKKALQANPGNFEANWKCARACRWYGEESKRQAVKDWEDICKAYGKEGMKYAEKAMELEPNRPEGYFWYGTCVGIYSDGVSIITALREGLKDKTQNSFEKVYQVDKKHENGGAVLALGRFWSVLPWPLKDNDKALEYFAEYEQYDPNNPDWQVYYSEVLIDEGGKKNKAKAGELIGKALKSDIKWWRDWAQRLKEDL